MLRQICAGLAWVSVAAAGPSDSPNPHAGLVMRLSLHAGQRFVQRADVEDRQAWLLPAARLAAFRRAGAVINEDRRTTLVSHLTVLHATASSALIDGTTVVTTTDVPRRQTLSTHGSARFTLDFNNRLEHGGLLEVADAAMADLPAIPVNVGGSWTTTESVTTDLGSGRLVVRHTVADVRGGIVQVDVSGAGSITGAEKDLPKLLPGTISLRGSAWFDANKGYFFLESYAIHDVLAKPAGSERIGYDETQTIDVVTYAAFTVPAPAP